jgi:maltose alpha-D-glucosyltransferase / alpha-amylase
VQQLEQEVLPAFLRHRGWFAQRFEQVMAQLAERALWRADQKTFLLAFVDAESENSSARYFLPLTTASEDGNESGALRTAEWTLAKIREHARVGVLMDAFAEPAFCLSIARCAAIGSSVPFASGHLRFERSSTSELLGTGEFSHARSIGAESTNTSIVLDDLIFMKGYRRIEAGPNPDIEMTRYLTQVGYSGAATYLGSATYIDDEQMELIGLFAFVLNQGDAWTFSMNHLERFLAEVSSDVESSPSPHELFEAQLKTLGQRVGEMHALLCEAQDPAFSPEPIRGEDQAQWARTAQGRLDNLLNAIPRKLSALNEVARGELQQFTALSAQLSRRLLELAGASLDAVKTRIHGNLHLGKVLLVADTFLVTGFEGDVSVPLAERRSKDSPLRDVATLLMSLDYLRSVSLERAAIGRPEQRERMDAALASWQMRASDALLSGYRRGVGTARCLPSNEIHFENLMRLFRIDRALKDLEFELVTPVPWSGVALRALLRELAA